MNRISAILLLAFCSVCFAQTPQIKSGATVYIEPMGGYETYLAAAFVKKRVPLVMAADKDKADYTIISSVSESAPRTPAIVINNSVNNTTSPHGGFPAPGNFGRTSASISVIDNHSSAVVFAYSVGKSRDTNQLQSAAEACAKHLKEFIEKKRRTG